MRANRLQAFAAPPLAPTSPCSLDMGFKSGAQDLLPVRPMRRAQYCLFRISPGDWHHADHHHCPTRRLAPLSRHAQAAPRFTRNSITSRVPGWCASSICTSSRQRTAPNRGSCGNRHHDYGNGTRACAWTGAAWIWGSQLYITSVATWRTEPRHAQRSADRDGGYALKHQWI